MARFCGNIGYMETVEVKPGIWEEQIVEHTYYGDITRNITRYQTSNDVNDNITVSNNISIVSDPYANENFQHMRYVDFMGTKRKIENIEVQYPRIILTLGGKYNGQ